MRPISNRYSAPAAAPLPPSAPRYRGASWPQRALPRPARAV